MKLYYPEKKYMKNFFILFFLWLNLIIYSQKENNMWFFGQNIGMDFNSGSPISIAGGKPMFMKEHPLLATR
jgi:hypothetical protein